jgi:hypothetical protein
VKKGNLNRTPDKLILLNDFGDRVEEVDISIENAGIFQKVTIQLKDD